MTTTFSGLVQDRGFNANNGLTVTAAALTLDPAVHAGRLIVCSLAAGQTYTLPAATGSGQVYKFIVGITFTGNGIIKVANSTDTFIGYCMGANLAGVSASEGAGGTDDTLTMNGTTSGGFIGSTADFTDYAAGFWYVMARVIGSGTMAAPYFSATV